MANRRGGGRGRFGPRAGAIIPYAAPIAAAGVGVLADYARNQMMRASPTTMYDTFQSFYQWYQGLTPPERAAVNTAASVVGNKTLQAVRGVRGYMSRRRGTPERAITQAARRSRTLALARRPASLGRSRALTPARSVSRSRTQSITRYFPRRVQPSADPVTGNSVAVYQDAELDALEDAYYTGNLTGGGRLLRTGDGRLVDAGRSAGILDPPTTGNLFQTTYPRYIRDPTSYRKSKRIVRKYLRRSRKSISY